MLPPNCLTIPRMDVPMETILGVNKKGDSKWNNNRFLLLKCHQRPLESVCRFYVYMNMNVEFGIG